MIAKGYGINWTWYLDYDLVEADVIRINRHYRLHNFDHSDHPKTGVTFKLHEQGKDRVVSGCDLNGRCFLVQNEKRLWDYAG